MAGEAAARSATWGSRERHGAVWRRHVAVSGVVGESLAWGSVGIEVKWAVYCVCVCVREREGAREREWYGRGGRVCVYVCAMGLARHLEQQRHLL